MTGYPTMKRYQFDVPAENADAIEEMKAKIGARTNGELFDNALTLLNWAIAQVEQGRLLASLAEDGSSYRELAMPALEKVRKQTVKAQLAGMNG